MDSDVESERVRAEDWKGLSKVSEEQREETQIANVYAWHGDLGAGRNRIGLNDFFRPCSTCRLPIQMRP
jgi:hypothetical protein